MNPLRNFVRHLDAEVRRVNWADWTDAARVYTIANGAMGVFAYREAVECLLALGVDAPADDVAVGDVDHAWHYDACEDVFTRAADTFNALSKCGHVTYSVGHSPTDGDVVVFAFRDDD